MKQLFKDPKKPLPLFTVREDGVRQEKCYACGECGVVYQTKEIAELCCKQDYCVKCGNETPKFWRKCGSCQTNEMWESATEIKAEEHDGPVYDEERDKYFESYDEAIEFYNDELDPDDENTPPPLWVQPCSVKPIQGLDLDSALESMTEELEDGYDHLKGVEELEKAVEEFNKKQTLKIWYADSKKKIKVVLDGVQ